jgi:hypothetical protein
MIMAEPPLGNRIKHIVCASLSCGKQQVEEKIRPVVFIVFFSGAKSRSAQRSPL